MKPLVRKTPRPRHYDVMTTEERFERMEHFTAGLAEQFQREREENRALCRDTERKIVLLAEESRAADKRLGEKIERFAEESRAADQRLGEKIDRLAESDRLLQQRIESLVSAMGQFLSNLSLPPRQ